MDSLEHFFAPIGEQIIGNRQTFVGPYGERRIVYADWTASGRLYAPIERRMVESFGPFVANTHSESNITGGMMTQAYHIAQKLIKQHVNAGPDDVIITGGSGMTTVINKFQRILGLKVAEQLQGFFSLPAAERPIVFVTHMEHHSNQTSWLETIADVEIVEPDEQGLVDGDHLHELLEKYKQRKVKIGSFTACSNVTGIQTPYHRLARIMHEHGGICIVDFAASAPYVAIDMHPADPLEQLDAIVFSPHKFLGGPGTPGVLIFDSKLYTLKVPDQPGGGTVDWTNPWHQHSYTNNIEAREDGGTPGFLQAIKAALAIQLKETMGVARIMQREEQIMQRMFAGLRAIPRVHILADHIEHRLGIMSFYLQDVHYNLLVSVLNDRFGIQVRGGCSCAGTYGHYLLHVDPSASRRITDEIDRGNFFARPGWVRLSIHPTTTTADVDYMLEAISETASQIGHWEQEYRYVAATNEYQHIRSAGSRFQGVEEWFRVE
jgi:selenocysteine lyase/cysteine desulfurase